MDFEGCLLIEFDSLINKEVFTLRENQNETRRIFFVNVVNIIEYLLRKNNYFLDDISLNCLYCEFGYCLAKNNNDFRNTIIDFQLVLAKYKIIRRKNYRMLKIRNKRLDYFDYVWVRKEIKKKDLNKDSVGELRKAFGK